MRLWGTLRVLGGSILTWRILFSLNLRLLMGITASVSLAASFLLRMLCGPFTTMSSPFAAQKLETTVYTSSNIPCAAL